MSDNWEYDQKAKDKLFTTASILAIATIGILGVAVALSVALMCSMLA